MGRVPDIAIRLIKLSEGLKDGDLHRPGLQPYLCPAGIATIGFGSTHYLDGRPVSMSDPGIDEDIAEALMIHEADRCSASVDRMIKVHLDDGQRAALIDFVYNFGPGRLQSSTLRQRINRSDPDAWTEFRKWVFGGGRKLPGLIIRRDREVSLWRTGTF